jgi:hypothetical protein
MAGGNRLRIWDPLEDRHVLDEPVPDRVQTQMTDNNELVVVLPPDRFYVLDVVANKVQVDLTIDPRVLADVQPGQVQVFSDAERYYLNVQRTSVAASSSRNIFSLRDRIVPGVNIKGELYAFHRKSGALLWKRSEPERSILQTPNVRLPFLIGLSALGGSWNGNSDATIVEIIDAGTGKTLATKENLTRDYIMQFRYDHEARRVDLCGKRTTIHIDFGEPPLALPDEASL